MIFWHGDDLVLTVQHHAHHRDPKCADYIEGINEWKRLRALPHNQEAFARFLEDASK